MVWGFAILKEMVMKQLRRFMIVVFMLLGCVAIQATDDLITQQITITLDEAGTLPDKIGSTKMYKITNLKIIGEINGTDFRMIRDMAGCDYQGKSTSGKLATLDLSEATIVSGGKSYYERNSTSYSTENNVLGYRAFYNCSSLTSIEIPSSVTSIGNAAFYLCSNLASVVIPSSVTSIGNNAFDGCSSLTSVDIPSSVTSIGEYAFYGCSKLTNIEIPSSVTSIGQFAFSSCSSLASVKIPSSVTSISGYAFKGCSSLMSVVLPSSVTWISWHTFENCSNLTSIEIPSSVTSIGDYAFNGCSSLASVVIPFGVTSIGDDIFKGCSSLKSVEIPSRVTSIGYEAFEGCSSLASVEIPFGVTTIDDYAFKNCSSLASIEIPSSVTTIKSAFGNCSSLTSVEIPSSVTSIYSSAFSGCSSLTSIFVSRETPVSIFSNVFDKVDKQKCTLYVPQGTSANYKKAEVWKTFTNIVENYYRIGDTPYSFGENLSVDNLALEDGKDFVANVPFNAANASYSRTMTSNWGTLCLPFAVETTGNADSKFYKIEGVNSNVITLSQLGGTIAAGTPVLVYSENGLNISASEVAVVKAPIEGAEVKGWQLVGSFAETEVPDDDYIISKNKFWLTSDLKSYSSVVKAVKTKGLRAYLKSGNSSAAKAHVLGFAIDDEDETTAIDAIDGLTEGTAEIYDIQGRRTDRLQKGLNIVKMGSVTKKIMVK